MKKSRVFLTIILLIIISGTLYIGLPYLLTDFTKFDPGAWDKYWWQRGDMIDELKSGGQTHRGIRIGDSYEKVVERYGEPHDKFLKDGKLNYIRYWAIGSHCVIYFYFQNDIVERVSVSL